MAPPSNKPRLSQLVPEQVAEDTAHRALEHVCNLTMSLLSPTAELRGSMKPRETQIFETVRSLAHYAIHGRGLDADVHEYLVSLIPLYTSVAGGDASVDGISDEADPETPLGLVICAALARERIDSNGSLHAVDIAALADLSATQVRLLMRTGEIPARENTVTAKNAKRFLQARRVAGIR